MHMDRNLRLVVILCLSIIFLYYMLIKREVSVNMNKGPWKNEKNPLDARELSSASQNNKIWVSLGLCYSGNIRNFYQKDNYPYKEVIPLTLLLWKYHLPQVNTIVRIVYTEPELTAKMRSYGAMLERTGAVVEWIPAGNMSCVSMSQLVRLFAGDNAAVADTDIVLSVDADMFVMSPEIIRPLLSSPDMVAWILQDMLKGLANRPYYKSTFCVCLLAMRGASWREVTGHKGSIEGLVKYYREEGRVLSGVPEKEGNLENWFADQLIITWGLLSSKVCTVPASSKLWELPGLKFDPAQDDSKSCFHGVNVNCKLNQPNYYGCNSLHFPNNQGFKIHLDKFYELTNNTITLDPEILGQ